MKTETNLDAFIGDLIRPSKTGPGRNIFTLGKTFTGNAEIMKIISVLSGKYSNGKAAHKSELDLEDEVSRFYVFILLFHQYFNDFSKRICPPFMDKIGALATALSISSTDKNLVTEFFLKEEPYIDKNLAIYFNNDRVASNVKYIGTNIMHAAKRNNEIVYLKYFEKYDLFLSRTFHKNKNPYHFLENVTPGEINMVNRENYFLDDYGHNTFNEIVESVRNHKPYQYFELPAAANTPRVVLDPDQGKIIISGSSSPFSPTNFFAPIHDWLANYGILGNGPLQVFIMLEYFNTYTSKFLLRLCRQCDMLEKEGKNIRIYWYFDPEDSDMREFGEHLAGIYKKGFEHCLITDGAEQLI